MNEYRVFSGVYDTNQKFVTGFGIDQEINWRPKNRSQNYADGYFVFHTMYVTNPNGSSSVTDTTASGRLAIESLTVHSR